MPNRMDRVQTPVIPMVGELIRQNPGTISLGQGVVHYGPPPECQAAIQRFFADPDNHKYRPVIGIPELVQALEEKLARENGIHVSNGSEVVVTAGGNMAFYVALLAVADAGDEVILNRPYYFNHEMAIVTSDCIPVIVPTNAGYHLEPEAIEAAITDRTRAVVTISPNNPSGAVYSRESLEAVNALCARHGIYHIHDEAYEYFTYDRDCGLTAEVPTASNLHFSPGSISGAGGHTISLYSFSKSYGFASWRIGYMAAPGHLMDGIRKILDTIIICPPVISQYAALGALQAGSQYCRTHLHSMDGVRQTVRDALREVEDRCRIPAGEGAFYFLLKVDTQMPDMRLVERLIRRHAVAVIPGSTFGMTDGCCLRVSYGALDASSVAEGIGRLVVGLKRLVS